MMTHEFLINVPAGKNSRKKAIKIYKELEKIMANNARVERPEDHLNLFEQIEIENLAEKAAATDGIAIGKIRTMTSRKRRERERKESDNNFNRISTEIYEAALSGKNSATITQGYGPYRCMTPEVIKRLEAMSYTVIIDWPTGLERLAVKFFGETIKPKSFTILW